MRGYCYSLIGKILAIIGAMIIFFPIIILIYWFRGNLGGYVPQLFDFAILSGFAILGIIIAYSGLIVQKRRGEKEQFLIKEGGSIHSGSVWKKGSESGLFLTSCGLVVSTNHESEATAHVGYRIVLAKRATCSDCILRQGKAVLDTVAPGRAM